MDAGEMPIYEDVCGYAERRKKKEKRRKATRDEANAKVGKGLKLKRFWITGGLC